MAGPARAGLFVYAKDMQRLAAFYEAVLGMSPGHASADLVVLNSPDIQLIVHAMPPTIAGAVTISSPPQKRENCVMKFFFTVPSIAVAESMASTLGGAVLPEQWAGPGFNVRNAYDPEGNVFQIRENSP